MSRKGDRPRCEVRKGDRSGLVSSYVCLGDIERNRGNWDAAEALYRQCLEIEEALGAIKDLERIEQEWDG